MHLKEYFKVLELYKGAKGEGRAQGENPGGSQRENMSNSLGQLIRNMEI